LSITGYGRRGPGADWIAFGDDAAVAGGLTATTNAGEPVFCGDAVADPVTGLFGAAAVLRSLAAGGGHLIDLALAGAAAAVARAGACESREALEPIWPS
jgi:crotonobetainyl-CoA:carnitine CoA-transferase CaiB-like acyl-CoA transferase